MLQELNYQFTTVTPATHQLVNARDVYKPDDGDSYETFLPEADDPREANEELRAHLRANTHVGAFILQERKEGVETNAEVWFQAGEPVFAFMAIECKKKYALDLGHLVGCAFNFAFVVPLDCRAVQEVVGRLYPAYRDMKYTGFADANFIAAKDGVASSIISKHCASDQEHHDG
jgi:hypothetical protein